MDVVVTKTDSRRVLEIEITVLPDEVVEEREREKERAAEEEKELEKEKEKDAEKAL